MKKLLSIALTLALTLSLSVTAFAEESKTTIQPGADGSPSPESAAADVVFSVAPAYTITIPKTVELAKKTDVDTGAVTYEQDAAVTASEDVRLLKGQKIRVTLSAGADGFVLTTDQNASLPYTVTVDDSAEAIENSGTVASFVTSAGEQTSTLHFAADDPTYAGVYGDTVTFTISIESE